MRIFGSIQLCFWASLDTQQLSDQGKLLAIYLLTGPHSNMLGCFRLPDGYITADLKWNIETVKKAFQELFRSQFLTRDDPSGWLIIHKFLKWNPIQNSKQGVGVQRLFDLVPHENRVLKPLIRGLLTYGTYLNEGFVNRLHTLSPTEDRVSKPFPNGIDTLYQTQDALSRKGVADTDKDNDKDTDKEKISMSGKPDVDPLFDDHFVFEKAEASPKAQQQSELRSQALEVLQFLNLKTGRVYRPVDTNLKLIMARLKTGATVVDCRQVIAKKTREWKGDAKMAEYLRPATLFNATKFEQYMGELVVVPEEEDEANVPA